MATIARLKVEMGLESKGFDSGLANVKRSLGGFGDTMKSIGSTSASLAAGFFGGNLLTQAAGQFAGLASSGLDFGKQLANVNSIAQLTTPQINAVGDSIIKLSESPQISATPAELAGGMYQVLSSGISNTDDALTILNITSKAATAGMADTGVVTQAVLGVMNAYGEKVKDVGNISDVMFQIVNDGVVTMPLLAANLGQVTATANSMGIAFKDVGAGFAVMTLSGIDASQTQTDLNDLMLSSLHPTTALTDAIQAHGYASSQDALSTLGMGKYASLLNDIAGEGVYTLYDLTGNTNALTAAQILGTDHGKAYAAEQIKMAHASDGLGATQKALNKQMESASYQLQQAKKWMVIAATLGVGALSPAIIALAKAFVFLMRAAVIPLIGLLSKVLTPVFKAFGTVVNSIKSTFDRFRKGTTDLESTLRGFGINVQDSGTKFGVLGSIVLTVGSIFQSLTGIDASGFFLSVANAVDTAAGAVSGIVDALGYAFDGTKSWTDLLTRVPDALKPITLGLIEIVSGLGKLYRGLTDNGIQGFLDAWGPAWHQISNGFGDLVGGIVGALASIGGSLIDAFVGLPWGDIASAGWSVLVAAVTTLATAGLDLGAWAINTVAPTLGGWASDIAGNLWGWLKGKLGLTDGGGDGTGMGAVSSMSFGAWTLTVAAPKVEGLASDVLSAVVTWLVGIWPSVIAAGITLGNFVVRLGSWMIQEADSLAGQIVTWVVGTLWPAILATSTTLGNYAIKLGMWLISEAETLAGAVVTWLVGLWPSVIGTATTLGNYAVALGSWLIQEADNLGQAVDTKVHEWWGTITQAAAGLSGYAVDLGGWLVSETETLAGAIVTWLVGIWPSIIGTATTLGGYAVNLYEWAIGEVTAGDLVSKVKSWVEDTLKSLALAISNYKIDVSAPDGSNITVDTTGIAAAIWGKLNVALVAPEGTSASANQLGSDIGKQFGDWVVSGIKSFFSGGGDSAGGGVSPSIPTEGWDQVATSFLGGVLGGLHTSLATAAKAEISSQWDLFKSDMAAAPQDNWNQISDFVMSIWNFNPGDLNGKIDGALSKIWDGISTTVSAWWSGIGAKISAIFGGGGGSSSMVMGGGIQSGGSGSIWDSLKTALTPDLSGIPMPSLPGWLTDGTLLTPFTDLINAMNKVASELKSAFNAMTGALGGGTDNSKGATAAPGTDPNPGQNDINTEPQPFTGRGSGAGFQGAASQLGGGASFSLPALDLTAFNTSIATATQSAATLVTTIGATPAKFMADTADAAQKYTDVMTWGGVWGSSSFTGRFLGDTSDAAQKYTDAFTWGDAWNAASFTGRFLGDTSDAAQKYTDVFTWGGAWDAATFTSSFNVDTSNVAQAYTDAFSWGDAWDGTVFTASFSIDTSGIDNAVAVADAAAAHIAAIMPHSPAKEGPLSRPITFDYIADNFAAVADRLKRLAGDSAGSVTGALGRVNARIPAFSYGGAAYGTPGGGSGGVTVHGGVTMNINGSGLDEAAMGRAVTQGWEAFVREAKLR